jgi:hypothetical protein
MFGLVGYPEKIRIPDGTRWDLNSLKLVVSQQLVSSQQASPC